MKPTPSDWPRISSALYYDAPAKAIDWLCSAFGFEVRIKIEGEGDAIIHSELTFGDGLVMVGDARKDEQPGEAAFRKSPLNVGGGNTQSLFIYVDDVEAHCQRARQAGAVIVKEPATTDYGDDYWTDRGYQCRDLEGHHWYFAQRLRSSK